MSTGTKLLLLGVGLIAANVLYQFISAHLDWRAAWERSFFQSFALVMAWLALLKTT